MFTVNIIGAGLAGLSAALTLAEAGCPCRLISVQPSERAQSVLAAGGINAAIDTMGEGDSPEEHFTDTVRAGGGLADEEAVRALTEIAPDIVLWLAAMGVPFRKENGVLQLRNFGGQKRKRTAYARSSTGKVIMTTMIEQTRRYEVAGLVKRFSRHEFIGLSVDSARQCAGVAVRDTVTGERVDFSGPVILAFGGMNGFFPEMTTGTTANNGDAAAVVFSQGVRFSNLEMIQYHPTTFAISGKCCLISEAARGEGGRLFILRDGKPWYFMEEKYPEMGNLMPRDVVSREMALLRQPVYLDMTGISQSVWKMKLPDLRREIEYYLRLDPTKRPVPVQPGIHYFMGGIDVDASHRTDLTGLYAAGECCSQYHGANRLGGNSMLGALCGGRKAANTLLEEGWCGTIGEIVLPREVGAASQKFVFALRDILLSGLGIVRTGNDIEKALEEIQVLCPENENETRRLRLGQAMLASAQLRRESRGAHYRTDFPERDESCRKLTAAQWKEKLYVTYKED